MEKDCADGERLLARLWMRRRVTRALVKLAQEVERLDAENAQLRAAVGFYRAALETALSRNGAGRTSRSREPGERSNLR